MLMRAFRAISLHAGPCPALLSYAAPLFILSTRAALFASLKRTPLLYVSAYAMRHAMGDAIFPTLASRCLPQKHMTAQCILLMAVICTYRFLFLPPEDDLISIISRVSIALERAY